MSNIFKIRKSFLWIVLIANGLLFVLLQLDKGSMRIGLPGKAQELPVLATIEPFSLTSHRSDKFSSGQLLGSTWIANFIFTRCPNQCPAMTARFATLQNVLPDKIKLVSFSVDPNYDTPDVLRSYAAKFGADPKRWFFLTGDRETLQRVRADFKLGQSEDPSLHSLRFALVDDKSRVRGYYDSENPDSLKQLLREVRRLAKDHE